MTVEIVTSILAILISLLADYFPGFKDWFGNLDPTKKRLFMLGAGLIVVYGAFGLSCAGLFTYWACTWDGAFEAFKLFLAFMVLNQTTFLVSPKPAKFSK